MITKLKNMVRLNNWGIKKILFAFVALFFVGSAVFMLWPPAVANAGGAGACSNPTSPACFGLIASIAISLANGGAGSLATGAVASFIGFLVFIINYIIATIAGFFIAVTMYGVQVLLVLNANVVHSAVVERGFEVTLGIANLGFILALIVIAIATIIRNQTYGIKQALWRLVVAALLINFSLPIAGGILGITDGLTRYFISNLPGTGGDNAAFAQKIAATFTPQQFFNPQGADRKIPNPDDADKMRAFVSASSAGISGGIASIIAVTMATLALVAITMVLIVFEFMLLARYVVLSILLVLMPFAWLFWVLPTTRGTWTKWWRTFTRWAFFAPIVVFFLWLVIEVGSANLHGAGPLAVISSTPGQSGVFSVFIDILGSAYLNLMQTFLSALVLIGLTIGGLIAANSLSITGAGAAIKLAKRAGRGAVRLTGKGAKRGGGYALRTDTGKRFTEKLQQWQAAHPNRFVRAVTSPVRQVGGTLAKARIADEKRADDAEKNLSKMSYKEIGRQAVSSPSNAVKVASMDKLSKDLADANEKIMKATIKGDLKTAKKERARADEIKEVWAQLPKHIKDRHERLRALYGRKEMRPASRAEALEEAIREEGREEGAAKPKVKRAATTPPPAPGGEGGKEPGGGTTGGAGGGGATA